MQTTDHDTPHAIDPIQSNSGLVRATCRPGAAGRTYEGECKTRAPDHEARLAAIAARVERELAEMEAKGKR